MMETTDAEDILKGLTQLQKDQVYEWIIEFRLSLQELAAWRRDREVFVKSVKYKTPIETPADFICRDIYELKLFGVRVADFFYKNGEPAFLKICGRVFSREEAMTWVVKKSSLKKPFLFSKGEPQRILNNLASDTRTGQKRTHVESEEESRDKRSNSLAIVSVVGGVRSGPLENEDERPQPIEAEDEKPSQKELDRAAAKFARKNPSNSQGFSGSHADVQTPRTAGVAQPTAHITPESATPEATVSNTSETPGSVAPSLRSGRKAALPRKQVRANAHGEFAAETTAVRSLARSCKVPNKTSTLRSSSRVTVPIKGPSDLPPPATQSLPPSSPADAVLASRLLNDPTLRDPTPHSESPMTAVQHPVKYLVPVSCENVSFPGQPVYSISANASVQTVYPVSTPSVTQDDSSKAYQAMVEIYLRQFRVGVEDFSDWLMNSFGSNLVTQGELFGKADILLTAIANTLRELEKHPKPDGSVLASSAKLIGVSRESLEKWNSPEIRPLFHTDKTALKYDLFQRVLPVVGDKKRSFLPRAEEIIRYKTKTDLATFDLRLGKSGKYCVQLVKNVLDFFSLESGVLDELPMEGNRKFRESLQKSRSIHAIQMLLNELGVLISYKNEICMFSNLFSEQDAAFCFEKPLGWLPPPENMFHVSIEDAVRAVTRDRRLRTELQGKESDVDSQKIRKLLEKYETNV